MQQNKLIIAIDGPGAAGKSTVAKILAKKLNLTYIDTGAMYRCLALYAYRNNIDPTDVDALVEGLKTLDIYLDNTGKVFLNGEDVSFKIRTNEVTKLASPVSAPRAVREILVLKQQELAHKSENGVVMDGRDIGTVVLTDANLKIYQVASPRIRAERRYKENLAKGIECNLDELEKEIAHRDYLDMNKGYGSLKKADDAIELDTSYMSIEEVVDFIYNKALELM
jgi:cytidylate kinase